MSFWPQQRWRQAANAGEGREQKEEHRIKKIFGFTLKSPLGYNKQIKTARALIIQRFRRKKETKGKTAAKKTLSSGLEERASAFCCSKA